MSKLVIEHGGGGGGAGSPLVWLAGIVALVALVLGQRISEASARRAAAEARAAEAQARIAEATGGDPTPWWAPWLFALVVLVIIALIVLALAWLQRSAAVRAYSLGYGPPPTPRWLRPGPKALDAGGRPTPLPSGTAAVWDAEVLESEVLEER